MSIAQTALPTTFLSEAPILILIRTFAERLTLKFSRPYGYLCLLDGKWKARQTVEWEQSHGEWKQVTQLINQLEWLCEVYHEMKGKENEEIL